MLAYELSTYKMDRKWSNLPQLIAPDNAGDLKGYIIACAKYACIQWLDVPFDSLSQVS